MKPIAIVKDQIIIEDMQSGDSSYEYRVGKDAHLTLVMTSAVTSNIQVDVHVRLIDYAAKATIIGLVVGKNASSFVLHTFQHHEAPQTTSNLLVKGIFRDSARFIYDGAIRVEKSAQHTDAYQRNENLLLSDRAYAESKPSLEILADDVRCTHGATLSSLPADQLWYLATRGIGQIEAEHLLVTGFLQSALERIPDAAMRVRIFKNIADAL